MSPVSWRALLLICRRIEVREPVRFDHSLSDAEVEEAVDSFGRFPDLAHRLSGGEVSVDQDVATADGAIQSLTSMGEGRYWPSPSDTRRALDELARPGSYDSLFVLWPQRDLATGAALPTGGWGLAIRATEWSNGATYATVASIEADVWRRPVRGEVWLHEWLHGVCDLYARRGFEMPEGDADGGERHGYRHSPTNGWSGYYGDLMTGRVEVGGRHLGITPEAWRTGSILRSASPSPDGQCC